VLQACLGSFQRVAWKLRLERCTEGVLDDQLERLRDQVSSFDVRGSRHSLLDYIMCATDVLIGGESAIIRSLNDVGKGATL
jgi:hypothetical protein